MSTDQAILRAIDHAARVAIRRGRRDIARAILTIVAPVPVPVESDRESPVRSVTTSADRMRKKRERDRAKCDAGDVTNVTPSDASQIVTLGPLPSDSPPSQQGSDSGFSSSSSQTSGSLKEASDLESAGASVTPAALFPSEQASGVTRKPSRVTRKREHGVLTPCPSDGASDAEVAAWFAKWKIDPRHPRARDFLDKAIAKGWRYVNWTAGFRTFCTNDERWAAERRANGPPGRTVQPVDMTAPWMADGYGETLGKEGTG